MKHYLLDKPLLPPYPEGFNQVRFGMGCFWGSERLFWQQDGVYTTLVGYGGGKGDNPTYEQVCTGNTNHIELVRVVYDSIKIDLQTLLRLFWESHDPTQGNRQGNDRGSQYRSAIFVDSPRHLAIAEQSKALYQAALFAAHGKTITTQIAINTQFYPAESYHQQYLAKNPNGYCGMQGTGISMPHELS